MFKNISKVVLASFLLTGIAKAALIYNDDSNMFTVDVKTEVYATHDRYGFVKKGHNDVRTTGAVEFVGKVAVESFYSKNFSENFNTRTYVKLDIPVFGYSNGAYGYSNATTLNQYFSTFQFIDRAHLDINHKYLGYVTIGRYKGFYGLLVDYSDVETFVGNPAHSTKESLIFGGITETGIAYSKSFAQDTVRLGVSVDAAKDSDAVSISSIAPRLSAELDSNSVLKRDYRVSGGAQINVTDEFKIGAVYNLGGFQIANAVNNKSYTTTSNHHLAHTAAVGLNYENRGTNIGLTGNYQVFDLKVADGLKYGEQIFGVEVGVSYDISGIGVGLRPVIQYDYQKSYSKVRKFASKEISGQSIDKEKEHTLNAHTVEVGLSYYVNPSFYYVAAAVVDLRTKKQVAEIDNIDKNQSKKSHYLGIGVVYKF